MAKPIHETRYRRLRLLLQRDFDDNQTKLAQALGKSNSYVNFLVNDPSLSHHKNLGEDLARQFEERLGLEPGWFDRETTDMDSLKLRRVMSVADEGDASFMMVPRRHVALSAGNGQIAFEEESAPPLAFRRDWLQKNRLSADRLVVAYAEGDSMEPRIHDGDTLLINLDYGQVVSGKIYAIRLGPELRVKRLIRQTTGLLIVSDNPAYPQELVTTEQAESLEILGQVVWVSGTL